jgi:hypothetical protein
MCEEQMELPLPEVPDDRLYFESTTLTADTVLAKAISVFDDVFILGINEEGYQYRASNDDARFWVYALERAKQWLLHQMG